MYVAACALVFLATYALTIVTTSIGYHRGLTHGAVTIRPAFRWLLLATGNWLTGVDPKTWVVLHRLHHRHSDTKLDPHSPLNVGILGILWAQLEGYDKARKGLEAGEEHYAAVGRELDFPLSWPIRMKAWWLPYVLHIAIAATIVATTGAWLFAGAYFAGVMSHVVQGGLINSLGHAWGGRNFDLPDNSRNNHPTAWFILGEGFQNNHHKYPASARFSYRWPEVDMGYAVCRCLEVLGVLDIQRQTLIPAPVPAGVAEVGPAAS